MLERDVAKEIDAYLAELGLRVMRSETRSPGGRARKAVRTPLPDRFGILPNGRWWGIEIKAPGARPRKDQEGQREMMRYLLANHALVIYAISIDDVRPHLNAAVIANATPNWVIPAFAGPFCMFDDDGTPLRKVTE